MGAEERDLFFSFLFFDLFFDLEETALKKALACFSFVHLEMTVLPLRCFFSLSSLKEGFSGGSSLSVQSGGSSRRSSDERNPEKLSKRVVERVDSLTSCFTLALLLAVAMLLFVDTFTSSPPSSSSLLSESHSDKSNNSFFFLFFLTTLSVFTVWTSDKDVWSSLLDFFFSPIVATLFQRGLLWLTSVVHQSRRENTMVLQ